MNHASTTCCPVCNSSELERTVQRNRLPAMQNYVYRTGELALHAKVAQLCLGVCRGCGFAFNCEFDEKLLDYDQGYDNSVPSRVMETYYDGLADYLNQSYLSGSGLLVDVGCGKGTFLNGLRRRYPKVKGLGIDPSYEGPLNDLSGNLRFIRDIFAEGQLTERPDLVICRHVLEHIAKPVEFLNSLRLALDEYSDIPVYVEVPDLTWILENRTFWDFCYEHCNYFTPASLAKAMEFAGFDVVRSQNGFGGQYIWMEALTSPRSSLKVNRTNELDLAGERLIAKAQTYNQFESTLVEKSRAELHRLKEAGHRLVVWGMATKGVLYTHLVDPDRQLIDDCIDVNPNKQNCFTPVTSHQIKSPDALDRSKNSQMTVIVMNENYLGEIEAICAGRGFNPNFLNAAGKQVGAKRVAA